MQLAGQHIHKFRETTRLVNPDEAKLFAKLSSAYATELTDTTAPDSLDRDPLASAEIASRWNRAADLTDKFMSRTDGRDMAVPVPMKIGSTDAAADDGETDLTG
jgi:hypothetical protein